MRFLRMAEGRLNDRSDLVFSFHQYRADSPFQWLIAVKSKQATLSRARKSDRKFNAGSFAGSGAMNSGVCAIAPAHVKPRVSVGEWPPVCRARCSSSERADWSERQEPGAFQKGGGLGEQTPRRISQLSDGELFVQEQLAVLRNSQAIQLALVLSAIGSIAGVDPASICGC